MKNHVSHSLEETRKIAGAWLKTVSDRYAESSEAVVVGLSGHLGAGKTAFTKMIAKELGVKEEITSPTFVLMKIYDLNDATGPWNRLVHIDAYRLERREDLEALQWEDLVGDPKNLILVEWPENVGLKEFGQSAFLKFEIRDGAYNILEI